MLVKVFGPGCTRCQQTETLVREVVQNFGNDTTVEKVTALKDMMAAGIMSTPALSIDGKVVCAGRIPTKREVLEWLTAAELAASPCCSSECCSSGCCGK